MPPIPRPGKRSFPLSWREQQTLDGLFRRHGDAVYRLAACHLIDREEASDVTQEVFLKVAGKLRELRDPEALWPWLRTVTLNLCRDGARHARRSKVEPMDAHDEPAGDTGWPGDADLTAMAVRDCVERLAPKERQVLIPYYQHEMTYREIAALLGWSVATVQWWMDRGLKHLAELVRVELEDTEGKQSEGGSG
jgi:RNA polymerase sigma-70 factor (ECF subfamily)